MKHRGTLALVLGLLPALLAVRPPHTLQYTLQLKAQVSITGCDYRITLTRRPGYVLARYARLDSIQDTRLQQDRHAQALRKSVLAVMGDNTLPSEAKQQVIEQFLTYTEAFKVCRLDSLQLETEANPRFVQLLDSVYIASNAQLERQEANKNRIVLDGLLLSVAINSPATEQRMVYAREPGPVSHPLLYRVLHQSLQLYRSRRPEGLLPLTYTGGY